MPVRGIIFALSAGILWGLVPLYIKFVDATDPYEMSCSARLLVVSAVMVYLHGAVTGRGALDGDNTTHCWAILRYDDFFDAELGHLCLCGAN